MIIIFVLLITSIIIFVVIVIIFVIIIIVIIFNSRNLASIASVSGSVTSLSTSTSTSTASLSTSTLNSFTSTNNAITNLNTATSSSITSHSTRIASLTSNDAAQTTTISALSNILSTASACAANGLLFNGVSCKSPAVNLVDFSTSEACNSGLRGAVRWNVTSVVVCTGTAWKVGYTAPQGSSINPAATCAAIVANGDYIYGPGIYHLTLSDGTRAEIACEGATSRGGDGSTALKVASSCATALAYFNIQDGRVYIDTVNSPPKSSAAVLVYCLNGVNMGGDGSTLAQSSASCNTLVTAWGKSSGLYYVGGAQM
jgi:hypothetical protein